MMRVYTTAVVCGLGLLGAVGSVMAEDKKAQTGLEIDTYGSLRMQVNHASVDNQTTGADSSYTGISDAYSRIGAKATYPLGDTKLTAKLEASVNTADLEMEDPSFFDPDAVRVKSVGASGKWGSLLVGKDWLPYYNNVAYPVDYFSTLYAGYSTYAFFRENQITYTTPNMKGLTASISKIKRTEGGPRGKQAAVSYSRNGLTIAAGMEDMDGNLADTKGVAVSYSTGPWYVAAKYEDQDGRGSINNLYGQYKNGKFTYKAGIGRGDQYSGNTTHLGLDYQYNKPLKLFAEYYSESENYAILRKNASSAGHYLGDQGFGAQQSGKALAVGLRYDF